MKDRLVKPQEAAAYLGIEMGTFYNWVSAKRIEVVRLSARALRVRQSVLDSLTEKGTQITAKKK